MEKKTDLTCPKCGASMTLQPGSSEAVCEYCGHRMLVHREKTDAEKYRDRKAAAQAFEEGKQRAREDAEKRAKKTKTRSFVTAVLVLAVICLIACAVTMLTKQKLDPMQYAEVIFSGVNGEGKAELKIQNGLDDTDLSDISFSVDPDSGLSEGDYVIVTASCEDGRYLLTSTSKKVEVQGLQMYLTDLDTLTDDQISTIYAKNLELQTSNLETTDNDVQVGEITPVKICLLTDGDKNSTIYVISQVECSRDGKSKTHYLVSYMENAVASDSGISLGSGMYMGEMDGSVSDNGGGFIFSYKSCEGAEAAIKTAEPGMTYSER